MTSEAAPETEAAAPEGAEVVPAGHRAWMGRFGDEAPLRVVNGKATKLTVQRHARMTSYLRTGAAPEVAAAAAGIPLQTHRDWMARGSDYHEALEDPEAPEDDYEQLFRMYWIECLQAQAEPIVGANTTLRNIMLDETAPHAARVRAAQLILRASDSRYAAGPTRVELTGPDGGPVRIADATETERRLVQSLQEYAALEAAREDAIEDAEIVDDDDGYQYAWG